MACEFILKSGNNKGKQCRLKGPKTFNGKLFCTRHYKLQEINAMRKEDISVCTRVGDSFDIIREIGRGAFGRVLLIQEIVTKEFYAMKVTQTKKERDLLFFEYTLGFQRCCPTFQKAITIPRQKRTWYWSILKKH